MTRLQYEDEAERKLRGSPSAAERFESAASAKKRVNTSLSSSTNEKMAPKSTRMKRSASSVGVRVL